MKPELIEPELKSLSKAALLHEIALLAGQNLSGLDHDELHRKLVEREHKASTGADHGVAIPHATIDSTNRIVVIFGKSNKGIPFNALDNEDSTLFFAVVSPSKPNESDASYLQIISSICRLMRSAALRERLRRAITGSDILEILRNEEEFRLTQPSSVAPK
jgi:mannitol/fructose-specific phosphotransferase system IIA component (Ntr-type)